jgi:predicted nucleic acid-binding protein
MNQRVCVDANLLVKLVSTELDSEQATELWLSWADADAQMIAPALLNFEVVSALWRKALRGQMEFGEARDAVELALDVGVTICAPHNLHAVAWEMASRFQFPAVYDSHYLALAHIEGCEFWTADECLYNAVHNELPWVRWLGEYEPNLAGGN